MSKNGEGWLGIYRSCRPIRTCHPIACVSSRMLPVACVATHGRPHALFHASWPCQKTPHVHLPFSMSGVHASRHTALYMSVRMRRSQVQRHLVLLCVKLHGTASCTSRPPSCVDTQQVKWLTPRPDPLDQATSSFSVDLRDFGPSGEFSSRYQSRIFFLPNLMS